MGALLVPWTGKMTTDPGYRSHAGKTLVAVIGRNRKWVLPGRKEIRDIWTWRGIYEWDTAEPLPEFTAYPDIDMI